VEEPGECPDCAHGQQEDESGMLYTCTTCRGSGAVDDDPEREHCTTHPERAAMAFAAYCRECWDQQRKDDRELERLRAETLRQGQRITAQDALLVASEEDAGRLRDAIGEHRAAVMHGARTVDDVTDADETLWALAGSPSGKETPEP
jgi:hypothetical protein